MSQIWQSFVETSKQKQTVFLNDPLFAKFDDSKKSVSFDWIKEKNTSFEEKENNKIRGVGVPLAGKKKTKQRKSGVWSVDTQLHWKKWGLLPQQSVRVCVWAVVLVN